MRRVAMQRFLTSFYVVRPPRSLRLCGGLILLSLALTGCRGGPQPPPSDLRPDPGYQRISPTGLHFSVDLPEGSRVTGGNPQSWLVLSKPGQRWEFRMAERAVGVKEGARQAIDAKQDALLKDLAGGLTHVISREDQQTGWLPGRLIQADAHGGKQLVALWLG